MPPLVPAPPRPWALASAAVAALLGVVLAAPLLGEAGGAVRFAFSHVCHQMPERSLWIGGGPVALCHRCLGVLAGLAGGVVAGPLVPRLGALGRVRAGRWLALAALPMAVDWLLGAAGVWANTPASRLATGALFGVTAGLFLAEALLARSADEPAAPPRPSLSPSPSRS